MAYRSWYPLLNDESWVRQQYITEGRSTVEIAETVGCHCHAVIRALKRFEIKVSKRGPGRFVIPRLQDADWLRQEIVDKPTRQIAEELGCTAPAVRGALVRHGIEIPKRTKYRYVDKSEAVKAGIAQRFPQGRNGKNAARWQGGRIKRGNYWWLHRDLVAERWPDHPRLALPGWSHKQEHVIVMEAELGRLLVQGEVVHHGPGGKEDNRPENLEVKSRSRHVADHFANATTLNRRIHERDQRIAYLEGLLNEYGIPYDKESLAN